MGLALLAGCAPVCEPGSVCVLIGTGELGFNGDGQPGPDTKLATPTSVREAPDGQVVVVDFSNMRVRGLADDGLVQTLVGSGIHAYSEPGVLAPDSPLENPIDAAWGPDGLLYVAALHEGRVVRVGDDGRIELVAGTGESLESSGDGAAALDATMGYPAGLAWGADGTLYIADNTNQRVRAVAPDGTIDTVVGTGEIGFDRDGPGTEVRLRYPAQLAVSGDRLYVADSGNHRVGELNLGTGAFRTVAGTGEAGAGGDGGPAADARLDQPTGLAVGPEEQLWIADLGNARVVELGADGTLSVALSAADGASDGDGTVFEPDGAPLRRPAGLHATGDGDLLVVDRGTHRVLRWRRGD